MHPRSRALICLWAALDLTLAGCRPPGSRTTTTPSPAAATDPAARAAPRPNASGRVEVAYTPEPASAEVRDRTGEGDFTLEVAAPGGALGTQATATPLPAADTAALLARLEPLPTGLGARGGAAPVVRPPTPPVLTGARRQHVAFPILTARPPDAAGRPPAAPPAPLPPLPPPDLQPVGPVAAELEVRVRFTEPMVAVAKVGPVTAPPARLTPAVAGTWRWIDTRVLTFTAATALPGATSFTLAVPAGARALSGKVLTEEARAVFTTPPVRIRNVLPEGRLRPDSPIVVVFDQDVDPSVMASLLRVVDAADRRLPVRVGTLAEARPLWSRHPQLDDDADGAAKVPERRRVVLLPTRPWPAGRQLRVILAAGAPSAEGPLRSTQASVDAFTVAAPFSVRGILCRNGQEEPRRTGLVCPAGGMLSVEFSNEVDPSSMRSSQVQVRGQPFEDHSVGGDSVALTVPSQRGQTFTIDVTGAPIDEYGQPLVGPRSVSFRTGAPVYAPFLEGPSGMLVLDPRFEIPQWRLQAQAVTELHVQLYAVQPADYFAFQQFEAGKRATPPGRRVLDRHLPVGPRHGADLRVDLRPALAATGTGHVIAVVRASPSRPMPAEEFPRLLASWFQVTRLGVTTRVDGDRAHAWVHGLAGAAFVRPQAAVTTSLVVAGGKRGPAEVGTSRTDADGHASLDLLPPPTPTDPDREPPEALLVAYVGADSTFVSLGGAERAVRSRRARWFVTDDRFLYKPGETIHLKGWVRWIRDGIAADLELPSKTDRVGYVMRDARGNELAAGQAVFTERGGFDLSVAVPASVPLGTASVTFALGQERHRHTFAIEEFRTPAFSVSLDDDVAFHGARPVVVGERLELMASAGYYAGGGLPGALVSWDATLQAVDYRPPGWDRYQFAPPWPRSDRYHWRHNNQRDHTRHLRASLGAGSTSTVQLDLAALPGRQPAVLTVDATVTDLDRMNIRASSRPIVVHPSALYVGLRLQPEHDDVVEAIVTDIDGRVVPGVPVAVAITGVLWSEAHRDDAHIVHAHACDLTSAATPVRCTFPRAALHAYQAIASIADERGRRNRSQLDLPWWGGESDEVDLAITPDRPSYRPGQTARLTIRSRAVPASAVLSVARGGVVDQHRLELTSPTTTVEVPIVASYVPDVYVQLDRFAARRERTTEARDDGKGRKRPVRPPLPNRTSTEVTLPVDLEAMRLDLRAAPTRPLVEPGQPATFEVEVRHDDRPVEGAEVALMVVDEAVLALSGKAYADPLAPFYRPLGADNQLASSLDSIEDAGDDLDGPPGFKRFRLDETAGFYFGRSGYGTGGGVLGGHGGGMNGTFGIGGPGVVRARKDLRASAAFAPRLRTDARGRATLTVTMPDNLTRFRVVAFAAEGTGRFGRAEGAIVTQRTLSVRTIAPRVLAQGDRFALPVLVQNLGTEARTVDVAVRAGNLTTSQPTGQRVTVAAGQRAELRFPMATIERGRAAIQTILHSEATASSAAFDDASLVTVPVYEPATTESFATYGVVDDAPQIEQLQVPGDIFPEVGGVEVEVSSSQVGELTDAFWYLVAYPYECAEQRSARMLATAAMFDLLVAFASPGRMTRAELERTVADDVRALAETQNPDGGWGYFSEMSSDRFVTTQVVQALVSRTVRGGRPAVLENARTFLRNGVDATLRDLGQRAALPVERRLAQPDDAARIVAAAAELSALAAAGTDVKARIGRLHAIATTLAVYPVEARARLLALMAGKPAFAVARAELLRALRAATHETAATATVTTPYTRGERLLLASDVRTSALTLDAFMREAPTDPRIDKLARGALAGRRRGRWTSTQDNLAVLSAMRRYFDTYERAVPAFTGKLWVGQAGYAERAFAGRSADRAQAQLGWAALGAGGRHDLALVKDGPGRMYYRVGITYAPRQVVLPALDAGFVVSRRYRALDDAADVRTGADGQIHVRLGARVMVELQVSASTSRDGVALVDPVPAGFEAVNTRLATAERTAAGADDGSAWDHRTLRDNRTEAFRMAFPEGTTRLSYTVRATTPGTFLAAPAKAEEMYSPETFGRSSSAVVVVE